MISGFGVKFEMFPWYAGPFWNNNWEKFFNEQLLLDSIFLIVYKVVNDVGSSLVFVDVI